MCEIVLLVAVLLFGRSGSYNYSAIHSIRFPDSRIMKDDSTFTVECLRDGLPLRHPKNYGSSQLKEIKVWEGVHRKTNMRRTDLMAPKKISQSIYKYIYIYIYILSKSRYVIYRLCILIKLYLYTIKIIRFVISSWCYYICVYCY